METFLNELRLNNHKFEIKILLKDKFNPSYKH